MSRRARATKRQIPPDARFNDVVIQKFINRVMMRGQKATAEGIVYRALEVLGEKLQKEPSEAFYQAIKNATPLVEVKPRRVGGATYQVPIEVRPDRGSALAMRWLLKSARSRKGRSAVDNLAAELLDAYQSQGSTVKKKEDTHRMAEANKAFVHYRW
ncbi:30S ribosomal protein S7 [Chloroflexota bacterium]